MALISDLVTELSVMSGIEKNSITVVARHLREAGLLSQKGRGRGAARATPLDAARLCIALMVGGKAKDAPDTVRDFGQLVCWKVDAEADHPMASISLEELCGLGAHHTFEEGLACLIGVWANEDAVAKMEAHRGRLGLWPGMLARLKDSTMVGEVYFGGSHYYYHHAAMVEAMCVSSGDDPQGLAEELLNNSDRYFADSQKYFSGIRSSREISGAEIMPLGEVIADCRPAGHRESFAELGQQMLEREREFREKSDQ